jgi:hypothetical protein
MKNYVLKKDGKEIELNEDDMLKIHQYYEMQNTADYVRDNYEKLNEEQIQRIAAWTRELMLKNLDISEEDAIKNVMSNMNCFE